jgi:hypothetical protein
MVDGSRHAAALHRISGLVEYLRVARLVTRQRWTPD